MADRTLVLAEATSGETVAIPVVDLDGTAMDGAAKPPSVMTALATVDAFSEQLRRALQTEVAPSTTKVEFSIGFAMRAGTVIPILVDDKAEGAVAVTMEWTNSPETNPSEPETNGRRTSTPRNILRRMFSR